MQDDFDLEGLSPADARAYVVRFIAARNQTARDRSAAEDERAMWKKRVRIAIDRGEDALAKEGLARAEAAHAEVVRLKREERDLDFTVEELKRRLAGLRQVPTRSVDADALLEQLEGIVGPDYETDESLSEVEAEVALEALKHRMEEEGGD